MATFVRVQCLQVQAVLLGSLLLLGSISLAHGRAISGSSASAKGSLVAYWGAGVDPQVEGTLASACLSGNYNMVIIAFLAVFGNSQAPQLILSHCDGASGGCTNLTTDINTCQKNGVKVFLSLGGSAGSYDIVSEADAQEVGTYLWNNFLGGSSNGSSNCSRPLGPAVLDGIDFDIEGGSPLYYGALAQTLRTLSCNWNKKLYLSAAPQCPFPDAYDGPGTGTALQTGLFDYVFVQFYNNYCEFQTDCASVLTVWNQWSSALPTAKIFLGLPAAPTAAGGGFVPSSTVISELLPAIKGNSSSYGGVMLWSIYWDKTQATPYSKAISCAL